MVTVMPWDPRRPRGHGRALRGVHGARRTAGGRRDGPLPARASCLRAPPRRAAARARRARSGPPPRELLTFPTGPALRGADVPPCSSSSAFRTPSGGTSGRRCCRRATGARRGAPSSEPRPPSSRSGSRPQHRARRPRARLRGTGARSSRAPSSRSPDPRSRRSSSSRSSPRCSRRRTPSSSRPPRPRRTTSSRARTSRLARALVVAYGAPGSSSRSPARPRGDVPARLHAVRVGPHPPDARRVRARGPVRRSAGAAMLPAARPRSSRA